MRLKPRINVKGVLQNVGKLAREIPAGTACRQGCKSLTAERFSVTNREGLTIETVDDRER